ncbi:MAG: IS110 family transposase [Verrucomicrobiota bacterium]
MREYISFDSHKHYTIAEREDVETGQARQQRIEHEPGAIRAYLADIEAGTPVAVEAIGDWYWIADEIEAAGGEPALVHPRKAKLMMGLTNKTDRLDVHGLNRLQRNRTLPVVWIPPRPLRDQRELTRTRMVLVQMRTRLKNRIQATISKYGLALKGFSDPYGRRARIELERRVDQLPEHTLYVTRLLLTQLDVLQEQITQLEARLKSLVKLTAPMQWLMTEPGIGWLLAAVITWEIGDIRRFPSDAHLTAYAGTTPRVHSSGGKTRHGALREDVNQYLKWAFLEAANSIAINSRHHPDWYVSCLYGWLRARRGYQKAVGAVARHLAQAAFHILSRQQPYQERSRSRGGVNAGLS